MLEFFVIIAIIAIMLAIIYAPVGWAYIRYYYYDWKFNEELRKLDEEHFWDKCRIIMTNPLGKGSIEEFEKSNITFEQVLKNKDVALNAIMELLN